MTTVATVLAASALFFGTNIDNFVVQLTLFLSHSRLGIPRVWKIAVGQYVGFTVIVTASALSALGLNTVPEYWVGLLGFVPLVLGICALIQRDRRHEQDNLPDVGTSLRAIVGMTVANGGDNISAYTPLFRTVPTDTSIVVVATSMVLLAASCMLSRLIATQKQIVSIVDRVGRWLIGVIYIAIGVHVIVGTDFMSTLVHTVNNATP